MSYSGKFTPLALNVLGGLVKDQGFKINPNAVIYQGEWNPSTYSYGTLVSSTVLNTLMPVVKLVYNSINASSTDVTADTYRQLILIGSTSIPALGNSRPSTFIPTYAGQGSWTSGVLLSDTYPPKNYPKSGTYSYIYQTHSSYAWITGWPGNNSWQNIGDTYNAAYLPSTGSSLTDYDEYFSDGFIGTVARQAYYELWSGQFTQYNSIVNSFQSNDSWKKLQNSTIASFVNTKTFMTGMYSNINDISTSDIAGVTQSFKVWGQDLINTGRSIYLPDIAKFGLPSVLLKTLNRNNVITDALKIALHLYSELTITEINEILQETRIPTVDQEKKIYDAFTLIQGDDLNSESNGILYGLNCKTEGIKSLADLLDIKKLFPNSYKSLTIPEYSTSTESAKIYDFIYQEEGINDRIVNWGDYLESILPTYLIISCGAFSMTMRQIKNISTMDIERFSQVVSNLELTGLDLPLINLSSGVPGDVSIANDTLQSLAFGSGNSKSFRQCDFYGAAAGYPYIDYYVEIQKIIQQLTSDNLINIYNSLAAVDITLVGADLLVKDLIIQANVEISNIYSNNRYLSDKLNYYWNLVGEQLSIEQRSIPLAIQNSFDVVSQVSQTDISSFVQQIETYSEDTTRGGNASILERISDIGTLTGQSIIAMMRESRNANRLQLTGGDLQNDVSNVIDICGASATATITNGKITSVNVTSRSSGYTAEDFPKITIYPVGRGAVLEAVLASDGGISHINILSSGSGYTHAEIEISPPPQCKPTESQQTYADSPAKGLVPPNLISSATSSPTVAQAIIMVSECNCDCWN